MFSFDLIDLFSHLPRELAVFFIGMTPVAELQAAIPVGLGIYRLSPAVTYVWALAGNLVPVYFLLMFLGPLSAWLMRRNQFFNRFFTWLFAHTRNKFVEKYRRYGEWALFFFIAIPTPLSGAWSSSVAAFIFGVPVRRALWLIVLGELIAGLIILGVYQGAFAFFH